MQVIKRTILCYLALLTPDAFAASIIDVAHVNMRHILPQFQSQMHRGQGIAGGQAIVNSEKNELRVVSQEYDAELGITHTTYQQYFQGIPIFGKRIATHSRQSGHTLQATSSHSQSLQMNGNYIADLARDNLPTTPEISATTAISVVQHHVAQIANVDQIYNPHAQLIYHVEGDKPQLAYHVSFTTNNTDSFSSVQAIVTAEAQPKIVSLWSPKQKLTTVQGTGFGGNQKIGRIEYGKNAPYLPVSLSDNRTCKFENDFVVLIDLENDYRSLGKKALTYPCSPPFYFHNDKMQNGAYSIANDAFYFGNVVNNMYRAWYRVAPLKDKIKLHIHYGINSASVHFTTLDNSLNIGDGDSPQFFPLVALDITAHEISHGFTSQHSHLQPKGESRSIDEAFSDMSGIVAMLYATGNTKWALGSDVMRPGYGFTCADGTRGAMRCIDDPPADHISIDHTKNYFTLMSLAKRAARNRTIALINEKQLTIDPAWLNTPPASLTPTQKQGIDILLMFENELVQDTLGHHASGIMNKAFYKLATTSGWDARKAFHVMLYANQYGYWTSDSKFSDAALGAIRSAQALGYDSHAVISAFATVGINCNRDSCNTAYT